MEVDVNSPVPGLLILSERKSMRMNAIVIRQQALNHLMMSFQYTVAFEETMIKASRRAENVSRALRQLRHCKIGLQVNIRTVFSLF